MTITSIIAIISALLAISEALSFIPGVKSNGIFQLVHNILQLIGSKINNGGK